MARALCRLARLRVLWRRDSPAMGDGSHLIRAAEATAAGPLLHFDHRLFNVVRYVCDDAFPPDRNSWPRPHLHRRSVPRRPRQRRWSTSPTPSSPWRTGASRISGRPSRIAARAAARHRDPRLRQGRADLGGLHRHPRPLPADADDRGLRRAAARLAEPVHLPRRAEIRRQGICPRASPASSCARTCATASPRAASTAPSIRIRSTCCSRRPRRSASGSPPARC